MTATASCSHRLICDSLQLDRRKRREEDMCAKRRKGSLSYVARGSRGMLSRVARGCLVLKEKGRATAAIVDEKLILGKDLACERCEDQIWVQHWRCQPAAALLRSVSEFARRGSAPRKPEVRYNGLLHFTTIVVSNWSHSLKGATTARNSSFNLLLSVAELQLLYSVVLLHSMRTLMKLLQSLTADDGDGGFLKR